MKIVVRVYKYRRGGWTVSTAQAVELPLVPCVGDRIDGNVVFSRWFSTDTDLISLDTVWTDLTPRALEALELFEKIEKS